MRPRSSLGRPFSTLLPGRARVGGPVDRRLGPAVDERPDVAAALVGSGVEHVGVARVDGDVVDAGVLADRQHGLPGLPRVGGLVQPAVAARRPERPHRRHVDHLGIARIDDDAADVHRILEAQVLPRLAAVDGAVDPVAVGDAALAVVLAGADPDHVGVVRVDGDAADRERALGVEDRRPGRPAVLRLPHPADGGQVPRGGVVGPHGDVDNPAGRHRRTDAAPPKA